MATRFRSMVEVNTSTRAQVSEPAADAKVQEKPAAAPQVKQEVEKKKVSVAPASTRTSTRGMQSPDRSAPASTRTMGTRRTRAAKAEKDAAESSSEPTQSKVNTRRSRRGAAAKAKLEEEDGMVTPATQRLHSLVQKMTDIEV
eukprot:COSAG02_NODE_525_length_20713_cov_5.808286_16_plen_143_part_00